MKRTSINPAEWGMAFHMDQGELVEGLLRTFLESQLERDRQRAIERHRGIERRRHLHEPKPPPVFSLISTTSLVSTPSSRASPGIQKLWLCAEPCT